MNKMLIPPDQPILYPLYPRIRRGSFILFILLLLVNAPLVSPSERALRVLAEFPSEKQMNDFDYVLGRGTHFDADENAIYFCSQMQHVVLKLDFAGNLLKRIGRSGQGPGDFKFPLVPYIVGDTLLVTDNGNSRIQLFTLDGVYLRQIRMIEGVYSLVSIKEQLFMLLLKKSGARGNAPAIFGRYDLNGKLLSYFGNIGKSDYNNFDNDNNQTIRSFNGELHCLQLYGTTYSIYSPEGELVRERQLNVNPLHNEEYRKTGWLYTYKSFCVDSHRVYATHAQKGKIVINVFNRDGEYLDTYSIKQGSDEIYEVADMKIIQQKARRALLLLVHYPDTRFILAEFFDEAPPIK